MDKLLVTLIFFLLLAVLSLITLYFIRSSKNKYKSSDGTSFKTKVELEKYEVLISKLIPLFERKDQSNSQLSNLGLENNFINYLNEGFKDPKTLIKSKENFKLLIEILEY